MHLAPNGRLNFESVISQTQRSGAWVATDEDPDKWIKVGILLLHCSYNILCKIDSNNDNHNEKQANRVGGGGTRIWGNLISMSTGMGDRWQVAGREKMCRHCGTYTCILSKPLD